MYYYQFNIGDYAAHTSHLSPMEDLAYRRLIDKYYLDESPITGSVDEISREIGLREHLDSVDYVLKKFFQYELVEGEDQWSQKRINADIVRYQQKVEGARKAGKASAEKRAKSDTKNGTSTTVEPTNNQELITKNQEPTNRGNRRFQKPTLDCVTNYFVEKGFEKNRAIQEAEKFIDHYESNGWKIGGKSPMKDWRAAVRNWIRRNGGSSGPDDLPPRGDLL